jgi:hypothetical protein
MSTGSGGDRELPAEPVDIRRDIHDATMTSV